MNQNNTTDQTNETILSSGKKHCRKCGVELDREYYNKIRNSSAFNQQTLDNSVDYIYEELK